MGVRHWLLVLLLALPSFADLASARKAAEASPTSPQAQLTLAREAEAEGNFTLAAQAYGEAYKLAPTDLAVGLDVADFLARAGDLPSALEVWDATARVAPADPLPLRRKARMLSALERMGLKGLEHDRVLTACEALVALPASTAGDTYLLCDCLLEPPYGKAQLQRCSQAIEAGLGRWPDDALLILARGRLRLQLGRLKDARTDLLEAARLGLPPEQDQLARVLADKLKEK